MLAENRLSLIYLLFGLAWIFITDSVLLFLLSGDQALLGRLQTTKGVVYVVITGGFFYWLLRWEFRRRRSSEAALRTKEEDFRYLFTSNPQPMWVYDLETLDFLEVNTAAIDQYGYTRDEFLNMTLKDIRPEEDITRLIEDMTQSRPTLQHSGEWRHKTASGEIIYVEIFSHTLNFQNKPAVIVTAENITGRKLAEKALQATETRMRDLMENLQDAVFSIDRRDLNVSYVNPAIEQICGRPPAYFIGKSNTWFDLIHPDDLEEAKKYLLRPGQRHIRDIEYRIIHAETGETRWVRDRAWLTVTALNAEGTIDGLLIDITERKQQQVERMEKEKLQITLEKELDLHRVRDQMLSRISHELRNPLTTISSSNAILNKYHDKLTPEKRGNHHEKIEREVKRMIDLTEDVLALLRSETLQTGFQPEEINLMALCQEAIDISRQNARDTHKIIGTLPNSIVPIHGDRKLLWQAISNLLSNAVKYSPDGGRVELRLSETPKHFSLQVIDEGIGIPVEDQQRLFKSFQRGSNVQEIPGNGLGLVIARQAIELHRGRLTFASTPGEGTVFTVHLPKEEIIIVPE